MAAADEGLDRRLRSICEMNHENRRSHSPAGMLGVRWSPANDLVRVSLQSNLRAIAMADDLTKILVAIEAVGQSACGCWASLFRGVDLRASNKTEFGR